MLDFAAAATGAAVGAAAADAHSAATHEQTTRSDRPDDGAPQVHDEVR